LAEAVVGAGFDVVNAHPLKSEMSVAAPKSQAKEPIQLDVVLVCRKREADHRRKLGAPAAMEQAIEQARAKARRLVSCGLMLSVNDRRVVVISQFLVAACAGRSAEDLSDVLSGALTGLDLAAIRLLEADAVVTREQGSESEKQLAFFDRAKARKRGGKRTPVLKASR
jgi:putative DNA methylase